MDLPDIRQVANHDCGVAACKAVMRYYGRRWSDDFGKRLGACEIDGTDPRNIEVLFRQLGFNVISGEFTMRDLRFHVGVKRPVITLVQRAGIGHYIVVKNANSRSVDYHCPVDGPMRETVRRFREAWRDVGRMGTVYHSFGIVPCPRSKKT